MRKKIDLPTAVQKRMEGSRVTVVLDTDIVSLTLGALMGLDDIGADFLEDVPDEEHYTSDIWGLIIEYEKYGGSLTSGHFVYHLSAKTSEQIGTHTYFAFRSLRHGSSIALTTPITLTISNFKLEKGTLPTDWSPAPEDTDASIASVKTIAEQTADRFTWIVESGTSSTDFTLTDRTATLVADAINLQGLVTFDGLSSFAKSSIIDSVQVGGRNLIVRKTLTNGYPSQSTGAMMSTDSQFRTSDFIELKGGEFFTICWRKDGGITEQWLGFFYYKSDKTYISCNDYKRTGNPVTITEISPDECGYIRIYWKYSIGGTIKLELGNKATDWTPAPEDVDSSISAVDTALANLCYDSNKTYINGGKIYTGTITATQIASKAITADKLNVTSLSAISANLGSVTAGSINIGSGKFIVTSAGALTATGATISGKITATEGIIGGKNISAKTETGTSNKVESDAVKYYVQAGAFKNKDKAQELVDKLKKAGFDAIIKDA